MDKKCESVIESRAKTNINALSVQTAESYEECRRCCRITNQIIRGEKEIIWTKKCKKSKTITEESKSENFLIVRKTKKVSKYNTLKK